MLEVRLCKPAIYKLKFLGGGEFGGNCKKQGGTKFLKFSLRGRKKGGDTIFDLNLVGGKTWRKLWFCQQKTDIWRVKIAHIGNKPET